jgi:hypothetical protein
MAKDKITEYDATAANNTDVGGVNLGENSMNPSDVNNAIREVLSHQKEAFGSGTPLYVDQTNNKVGIGTSSPNELLHANGSSTSALQLTTDSDTNGTVFKVQGDGASYIYNTENAMLRFGTNNLERLRIQSDGKIGINQVNPSQPLHLTDADFAFARFQTTAVSKTGIDFGQHQDGSGHINLRDANSIKISTGDTERMRITTSDVIIGRTDSTIDTSNFGIFLSGNPKGQIKHARDATASQNVYRCFGNAGNFNILGDGDTTNTNNRYGGISDRKLKENEKPANSQWEDIKALQIKNFNFKEYPNRKHIGVIAQDLEESGMSSLVKEDEDGIKSVGYSVLYIKAMKALQEAMTRIETLEAEVKALKGE